MRRMLYDGAGVKLPPLPPHELAALARLEAKVRRARSASASDLSLARFLDELADAVDGAHRVHLHLVTPADLAA
jgi:hypothetical protein